VSAFLHCPHCGKKGVTRRIGVHDDYWCCRYCAWSVYTSSEYASDRVQLARLATHNPDREGIS